MIRVSMGAETLALLLAGSFVAGAVLARLIPWLFEWLHGGRR